MDATYALSGSVICISRLGGGVGGGIKPICCLVSSISLLICICFPDGPRWLDSRL